MSVKDQIEIFGEMSPSAAGAKHVADIVAALTPPTRDISILGNTGGAMSPSKKSVIGAASNAVPGLVGGAVGYFSWKKHPVLGFLAGHAVGQTAGKMFKGNTREALCDLGVEAVGVVGALKWKKHPVFGWLVGIIAGTAVAAMVPGSQQKEWWQKVKSK